MKLKKTILRKVQDSPEIFAKLIRATGKSYQTIKRWVDENDEMLTLAVCLKVICQELEISDWEEVLELEKVN